MWKSWLGDWTFLKRTHVILGRRLPAESASPAGSTSDWRSRMGGGGGGGWDSGPGDLDALLAKARAEVKRKAEPTKRNVFLSFAYEDVAEVNLLRGQARNENSDLEFNDW